MGGAWERMVASVKRALKVVIGNQVTTDEVLATVLSEVEYIVNSRPLTHVSSDPRDPEALTPNHILLGRPSPHFPPGVFTPEDMTCRKRWKQAQAIASHFWKRWVKEYLPTLTCREKWKEVRRNLCTGDVVLVVDPNAPRGYWPLARVTKVFEGRDGQIRSAEVQNASGSCFTRPVTKLCLLEESSG